MESKAQYRKGCVRTVILKMLSERLMYGYEIAQELARRSENVFALGQGTLYPLLYSLERKKLIVAVKRVKDKASGRERLFYGITPKGKQILDQDIMTWLEIVKGMSLVLKGQYEY